MLVLLLGLMLLAAFVTRRAAAAEATRQERLGSVAVASRLPALATAATLLCVVGVIAGGLAETRRAPLGVGRGSAVAASSSVSSLRYEYWRVGGDAFARRAAARHRRRQLPCDLAQGAARWTPGAVEVHSLALEMATELGIPGLMLLGLFVGGVAVAGRRALGGEAPVAPAACAVSGMWLCTLSIDWDWQMPAVTLPALVLAGALLAEAERRRPCTAPDGQDRQRQLSGSADQRRHAVAVAVSFLPSSELARLVVHRDLEDPLARAGAAGRRSPARSSKPDALQRKAA